jgi:hypothetical protein
VQNCFAIAAIEGRFATPALNCYLHRLLNVTVGAAI